MGFSQLRKAAQFHPRQPLCFRGQDAPADMFLGAQLDVSFEFGIQLLVCFRGGTDGGVNSGNEAVN